PSAPLGQSQRQPSSGHNQGVGSSRQVRKGVSPEATVGHFRDDRNLGLGTITCCRRSRFSASRLAGDISRDRTTSGSLVRKPNIGVSVSYPADPPPRKRFSVATPSSDYPPGSPVT